MLAYSIEKKTFVFKQPSGTSRGVLTEKLAWFISLWDSSTPKVVGVGECSVIVGLSPDYRDEESYKKLLNQILGSFCEKISFTDIQDSAGNLIKYYHSISVFPSVLFGLETAVLDLKNGGKAHFFDTDFTLKQKVIPINGLIWMGTRPFIEQQIDEKISQGFSCLKMKVGAINFVEELDIIAKIRKKYKAKDLMLRVDANGSFPNEGILDKLKALHDLDIHSIEQPIKPGNWKNMSDLCSLSMLPIALDEELIGVSDLNKKRELLEVIKPHYIILKPSLHGGMTGCTEWIHLANEFAIPWWMTSALESNVGLNAIAQFTSTFQNDLHQGLGTGSLYVENTPTDLKVENGFIFMNDLDIT